MKRLFIGFFLILAVGSLLGCRQPAGSIIYSHGGGGTGGGNVDFWWLEARKHLYNIEQSFNRDRDFKINSAEGGSVKIVAPNDPNVRILIIPNPDSSVVMSREVTEQFFPFSEPGEHEVRVTYNGTHQSYFIEVRGTWDRENDHDPGGLGGGIIWD